MEEKWIRNDGKQTLNEREMNIKGSKKRILKELGKLVTDNLSMKSKWNIQTLD